MENKKNQILAELYAIRAGLSVISIEKDKIVKSENNVKKDYDAVNNVRKDISNEKSKLIEEEKILQGCNQSKNDIKKEEGKSQLVGAIFAGIGTGFFGGLFVPVVFSFISGLIMDGILGTDYNWGFAFDYYWYIVLGCTIVGGIVGFIAGQKIDHKEEARINKNYDVLIKNAEKEIKLYNDKIKGINKNIDNLTAKKYVSEKSYNSQLSVYNDAKSIVLSTTNALYNSLVDRFNSTLDCRDWKNIDLIIFYYETGRADTLKEALFQVDRQRQNDALIKAIKEASINISQTIQRSINELRSDMNVCFNNLSDQLNMQHNEQMKVLNNINSSIVDLKKLSIKIDESIIESNNIEKIISSNLKEITTQRALNDALIEKISINSAKLMDDVNYVVNYQKPSYIS